MLAPEAGQVGLEAELRVLGQTRDVERVRAAVPEILDSQYFDKITKVTQISEKKYIFLLKSKFTRPDLD